MVKYHLKTIRKIKKEYNIIMWDILSYDFEKNITSIELQKNVLDNLENGSIIVFTIIKNQKKFSKKT